MFLWTVNSIKWLKKCAMMLISRDIKLIIVLELRVLLLCIRPGYLKKLYIQERTGHMSLTGLRHYERTNTDQQQPIAKVLALSERSTFQEHYFARSNVMHAPQNPTQNYYFEVNIYLQWKHTYPASTRYSFVCLE